MYRQCGQCPVWTLSNRQCAEEVLPTLLCASKEGGRKRSNWTLSKGQAQHGKLLKLMMPKQDQNQEQEKDEDETIEQLNNFCNLSIYHCNLSGRFCTSTETKSRFAECQATSKNQQVVASSPGWQASQHGAKFPSVERKATAA